MSVLAGPTHKNIMSTQECVTDMESCEFTYKWTIKKFGAYQKEIIESSNFSSNFSDFNDVWMLKVNPNMEYHDNSIDWDYIFDNHLDDLHEFGYSLPEPIKYLSVQLKLQSFNGTLPLFTICKISIHPDYSKNIEYEFERPGASEWMNYITRTDLLKSSRKYLPNGDLTISCTMTIFRKTKKNTVVNSTIIATQLSADLKKLLLNEQSADVTIKVGKKSFHVIKGILAARSPVFDAMFAHKQFKENKEREVIIKDIDEHVFEEFLHYIYTDETKNVNKMPMELLAAAEKYQVDRLKNICEEILCRTINSDNVSSILVFSNKYNVEKLSEKCLEFIKTNLQDVLSKKTFQLYKKMHPEVFESVLKSVVGIN